MTEMTLTIEDVNEMAMAVMLAKESGFTRIEIRCDHEEALLALARRAIESESRPQSQGVPKGDDESRLIQLMRELCEELGLLEEKDERAPILEALNVARNIGAEVTARASWARSWINATLAYERGRSQAADDDLCALDAWTEADGDVLWWVFPVNEPPHVGSPLDDDWPGYHTHWQRIPTPAPPSDSGKGD